VCIGGNVTRRQGRQFFAGRLLREKSDKHAEFYAPIKYH
jgi:hypothetical protein